VVFRIGVEEFAVDIMHAKEVVEMRDITPVPETRPFVEGVMNLRGSLVPVLDLRRRLRARPASATRGTRIMVVQVDERLLGLIVDGASEVVRAGEESIEAPPDIISESEVGYVEGVVNLGGRYLTMINLKRVLTEEVGRDLDEVVAMLAAARTPTAPAIAV
jgi:purine-binding chemotaxis protein CheW